MHSPAECRHEELLNRVSAWVERDAAAERDPDPWEREAPAPATDVFDELWIDLGGEA